MSLKSRYAKLVSLFIVLSMVGTTLLMGGCTSEPEPTATSAPPADTAVPPTDTPVPPTDTPALPAGPKAGGKISIAFQDDPNSFDPILGWNVPAWVSLMWMYRGLMLYNGQGPEPDMAADWPTVSDDGLTYTFKLKEGMNIRRSTWSGIKQADLLLWKILLIWGRMNAGQPILKSLFRKRRRICNFPISIRPQM